MKIQESGENYLECILMLSKENGTVRSIDIVNALNFSKPSVSIAMRRLRENGYVEMDENGHITLTDTGREIAVEIYDRHQTLTKYLLEIGVSPEVAAEDACRIEHVLSQETFDCMKQQWEKNNTKK